MRWCHITLFTLNQEIVRRETSLRSVDFVFTGTAALKPNFSAFPIPFICLNELRKEGGEEDLFRYFLALSQIISNHWRHVMLGNRLIKHGNSLWAGLWNSGLTEWLCGFRGASALRKHVWTNVLILRQHRVRNEEHLAKSWYSGYKSYMSFPRFQVIRT